MFSNISPARVLSRFLDSPLVALGFLLTVLAAMVGIVAVFRVTEMAVGATGAPCIVASMGASAVILYGLPETPAARLRSLFAGHLLSGFVGILATQCVGDRGAAAAIAVGGALLAMALFRCVHPPGGATALTVVVGGSELQELGFSFLVSPLLMNLIALGGTAWVFRKLRAMAALRGVSVRAGAAEPESSAELSISPFGALAPPGES